MNVVKIADGAYFVPAYSESMIAIAYDTRTTIQALGPCADEDGEHVIPVPAKGGELPPTYAG